MANHVIFDRALVRKHRERSTRTFEHADYLFQEATERLAERIEENDRLATGTVLEIGSRSPLLKNLLSKTKSITNYIITDLAHANLEVQSGLRAVCDEEFLPIAPGSIDLIASVLSLHWVNDLPGALIQMNRALKPKGFFVASLLGGDTLKELRHAVATAESEMAGISPRISPVTEVKDAGSLIQRAGFALPVTDTDRVTVMYPDALTLMRDLQSMGESNALVARRKTFTSKRTLQAIAETYRELYATPEGHIPATFEIITLTGWKS